MDVESASITTSFDFLTWTRKLFKLYGLNLSKSPPFGVPKSKRRSSLSVKRFIVSAIFMTELSLRVYKLTSTNSGGGLIDISMIFSIISVLITHSVIQTNHSKVGAIISSTSAILDQSQRDRIIKFDQRINAITIMISLFEYAILTLYSAKEGPFEAILMLTGFKIQKDADFKHFPANFNLTAENFTSAAGVSSDREKNIDANIASDANSASAFPFIIVQLIYASVSYRFLGLLISQIYYIVIQYISAIYAESVFDSVYHYSLSGKVITIRSVKTLIRLIECYNEMKQCVNENLGTVPFLLMGSFFAHIASGTAHVILHYDNFKLIFTVIVLTTLIIYFLLMTLIMIELASRSYDSVIKAKTMLIKMLSASLTEHAQLTRSVSEIEKLKISLLIYLINLNVTPSIAFNMFIINRSLILKFTSSVVPLTVMIIETSIQINLNGAKFTPGDHFTTFKANSTNS